MKADLLALAAIALWGTLAPLGVKLSHVPPFLLTGLGLLVGSLIALPLSRFRLGAWKVPVPTLAASLSSGGQAPAPMDCACAIVPRLSAPADRTSGNPFMPVGRRHAG